MLLNKNNNNKLCYKTGEVLHPGNVLGVLLNKNNNKLCYRTGEVLYPGNVLGMLLNKK